MICYCGVTVYTVGRNITNALWSQQQSSKLRESIAADTGERLGFFFEYAGPFAMHAWVPYTADKQFPVPKEAIGKIHAIAQGLIEQFGSSSGLILPGAPALAQA